MTGQPREAEVQLSIQDDSVRRLYHRIAARNPPESLLYVLEAQCGAPTLYLSPFDGVTQAFRLPPRQLRHLLLLPDAALHARLPSLPRLYHPLPTGVIIPPSSCRFKLPCLCRWLLPMALACNFFSPNSPSAPICSYS